MAGKKKHGLQPGWITLIYLVVLYAVVFYLKIWPEKLVGELLRLVAVAGGFIGPHLLIQVLSENKPKWDSMLITVMILVLLLDMRTEPLLALAVGLMAAGIKSLLRFHHQPIVNPAAAGLFVMSFMEATTSWWGVSFSPRFPIYNISMAMVLTVPVGLYLVWKYKKLPTLVSVPVVFTIVYFVLKRSLPVTILLEGTFAFFLLIMATEPKTSPLVDWQEWVYGAVVGAALGYLFVYRVVSTPYLVSLMIGNLVFFVVKWGQLKMATTKSKKK